MYFSTVADKRLLYLFSHLICDETRNLRSIRSNSVCLTFCVARNKGGRLLVTETRNSVPPHFRMIAHSQVASPGGAPVVICLRQLHLSIFYNLLKECSRTKGCRCVSLYGTKPLQRLMRRPLSVGCRVLVTVARVWVTGIMAANSVAG